MKEKQKRSNLQILVCNCHSCQAQHFLPGENYRSFYLFDQNMSPWWQQSCLARCRPSNICRRGGNEVPEPMFLKTKCRHGDKCPVWRDMAVQRHEYSRDLNIAICFSTLRFYAISMDVVSLFTHSSFLFLANFHYIDVLYQFEWISFIFVKKYMNFCL